VKPVLANSIPKAGSRLLWNCLERFPQLRGRRRIALWHHTDELTAEPGEFIRAHLPYSARRARSLRGFRIIVNLREPRDVAAALLRHIHRFPGSAAHAIVSSIPEEARIESILRGWRGPWRDINVRPRTLEMAFMGVRRVVRNFERWSREPGVLTVHFEELLGGGAVQKIADHLGLPVPC
jgi:hypothetical protein